LYRFEIGCRMTYPKLRIREASMPSLLAKHPWVLATSLQKSIEPISKDSIVDLVDPKGKFIGRGLFNPDSRIAVRVYCWHEDESIDDAMFDQRIDEAIALRGWHSDSQSQIVAPKNDKPSSHAYSARRLIFSEADRMSGLIVDAYGPYLVVQVTASGILTRIGGIIESLSKKLSPAGIILQVEESTAQREGIDRRHELFFGKSPVENELIIAENDTLFHVDLLGGQKTGHYLDQRQNRLLASDVIQDGSRVLDVCSYSGGFACTIAKKRPLTQVTAIDGSQKALDLAARNAALNDLNNVSVEQNDFYKALEQRLERGETYDAIILDPPRMASARSQVQRALAAYHRLNYLAVRLLRAGGVLVTCSCSGRVTHEDFRQMLLGVSKRSGKEVQIVHHRAAADDHPTSINCPESDYLKCFVCKIF
jgi:23S rRNA (cytosine1962-C5)-methyltransferase